MTNMTILMRIFLINFSKKRVLGGSTDHPRKDGSMFTEMPFEGRAAIIWDPTEDKVKSCLKTLGTSTVQNCLTLKRQVAPGLAVISCLDLVPKFTEKCYN